MRDFIRPRAEAAGCEVYEDVLGNLIVHKPGAPADKRIMFAAHMDEVGIIIKALGDDGYLKFACVGGVDVRVLIGKRVLVGANHVPGIIGIKAVHLTTQDERKIVPKINDMYIDIGASSREEAEKLTCCGDYAVFDSFPVDFGEGMLKARAIDDRVGCATMLKLIENGPAVDSWYVFTVQEEVGTRGAAPASHRIKPDAAIILEGTTAGDLPDAKPHLKVCAPGAGAVLPFMDNSAIYDREMFNELRSLAEKNGIRYQIKQYVSGGTDAGNIQRARAGIPVAAISAAVRYIHSPSCVASIDDFEQIYALAAAFLAAHAK